MFPLAVSNSRCYFWPVKVNRTATPVPPSCFFVLFRCYCGFVCPTKHIKAPTPCFFVQIAVGSSVPQSTKKHSTVLLRANMFQHSVTVLCIRLPCPPTRRAFHAFGAFSVLLWFRLFHSTKHQKAPTLCFFGQFAVGSSVYEAPKCTKTAFSSTLVSAQCHSVLCSPSQ